LPRLIAIGDIHGRLRRLRGLMEQVQPTEDDTIIFLGDYVDRGPDSFEVVEFVSDFADEFPNTVTLRGNHEDFIISLFMGNMNESERKIWIDKNGGNFTLSSYRRAGHALGVHQEFYMSLQHSWENEQYFFCHAGVKPGVPLDRQSKVTLLEIREPFISSAKDFGKIVVHGHTPCEAPEILPNRINIDTGAGRNGRLTAIELPSLKIWQE